MEFVQIKHRVRENEVFFWWCKRYSAIWCNSREHSKNVFAISLGDMDSVHVLFFFMKNLSPNVLENQTMARLFKASLA